MVCAIDHLCGWVLVILLIQASKLRHRSASASPIVSRYLSTSADTRAMIVDDERKQGCDLIQLKYVVNMQISCS